eukprot:gene8986-12146_t
MRLVERLIRAPLARALNPKVFAMPASSPAPARAPAQGPQGACASVAGARFITALVMIVRNEARQIEQALASALPHVDFALVLDTGSQDGTPDLARAAGARVAHFTWCDDFAAARNHALALAGADWHLVLDADERLQQGGAQIEALRNQVPDFVGVVQVASSFGTQGEGAASWISRVLPGPVRYAGRVHEQP